MLDQLLISQGTATLKYALVKSDELAGNFRLISQAFDTELLNKIQQFILQSDTKDWTSVEGQTSPARVALRWQSDTVLEELHQIGQNITEQINTVFGLEGKKFQGLQIWRDTEGYEIKPHVDNPKIDISLQIYLFDCPEKFGTSFIIKGKTVDVPFINNTGYITYKNKLQDRLFHWTTNRLESGLTRYSLYFTWGQLG